MSKQARKYITGLLAAVTVFSSIPGYAASADESFLNESATEAVASNMTTSVQHSSNSTVWLTEIYPNDLPRHNEYTALSGSTIDSMDYIEVYNGSETELDFGNHFELIYNDTSDVLLTFAEANINIPAQSSAVFWVKRVDLEGKGTLPDEAAFRASHGIPEDVPVFSVNNQKALKNSTATISIVSKETSEVVSAYTYVTADAGGKEGSSVHLQAVDGQSEAIALAKQAEPSAGQVSPLQQEKLSKPVVTAGASTRISQADATVSFTSSKAGSYYYAVVDKEAAIESIDTTGQGSQVIAQTETVLQLSDLTSGAKRVYVVVKDEQGQLSEMISFELADIITDTSIYLTEIFPNDLARHEQYEALSGPTIDSMDYIEVYNASKSPIDFAEYFDMVYTDLSASPLTPKTFTYNEDKLTIPGESTAVFWVRRVDLESKGTMPTEADFRASFSIPDEVPVFSVNNQTALKNTTATISINAKGNQEPISSFSYVTADAGTKEGSSVHLQAAEGVPGAIAIARQADPTAGAVNELQKTPLADPGVEPSISIIGQYDDYSYIDEGKDLSIPYAYEDPTGVKQFTIYYRTDDASQWTAQAANSFNTRTPGKFYVEIGADRYLNKEYIEYYVEAQNTFRTTETPIHRVYVQSANVFTGIRSNILQQYIVSGQVELRARAEDNEQVSIAINGEAFTTTRTLEQGAYLTMDISGLDGRKNAILVNDQLVQVFSRWYDILPSRAIKLDSSLFDFNTNGDAEVAVRILAGTEIDAMDISPGTASDNFSLTNFTLVLPDGTILHTNGTVQTTDNVTLNANKRELELHFTIPAAAMNANQAVWDTTELEDGSYEITLTSGELSKSIEVQVDNSGPIITANVPEHINGAYTFEATIEDASAVADASLSLTLDGQQLNSLTFNGSTLTPGAHTLTATVKDVHGNIGTRTWSFTSSVNDPVFSNVKGEIAGSRATLSATLTAGADAKVSFHEATELSVGNGITIYQGAGDDTVAPQTGALGTVTSHNGRLPYQMYTLDVDQEDSSVRLALKASTDYGKDVRLYVSDAERKQWVALDASYSDGTITAVFNTSDYAREGKVYVMAQGRGLEMSPSQAASRPSTAVNDYVWDGLGEPEQYDFTIAWQSDTQYYSERFPHNFELQNNYIADNKERLDIRYVVHTGDIVDDIDEIYQWEYADRYMSIFEDAGLPYGVLGGNHDIANHNARYELYQQYFGEARFKNNGVYGESYKNNIGHYDLVTAGGQEFIFVYMSYDFDHEATAWMNKVLAEHSDRIAILALHNYVRATGELDAAGEYFQQEVVAKNPNLRIVLGGHYHGAAINVAGFDDDGDGEQERKVYQIVSDYQTGPEGGNAYFKNLYFDLANSKVYMNAYSPKLDDYNYFDADKLASYDIGVQASALDIYELDIEFNTAPKTLNVTNIEAIVYNNKELGTSHLEQGVASFELDLNELTRPAWIAIAQNTASIAYSDAVNVKDESNQGNPSPQPNPNPNPNPSTGNGPNDEGSGTDPGSDSDVTPSDEAHQISINVAATSSSAGVVHASLTDQAVKALEEELQATGNAQPINLELQLSEIPSAGTEVELPVSLLESLMKSSVTQLTIEAGDYKVIVDRAALQQLQQEAASKEKLEIGLVRASELVSSDEGRAKAEGRPQYSLTLALDGASVDHLGQGEITVAVPYALQTNEHPYAVVVYSVNEQGEIELVDGGTKLATNQVEFTMTSGATLIIGYHQVNFDDVSEEAWYYDAVTFSAAREFTNGKGNGQFNPKDTLTRAEFLVMLMRAYDIAPTAQNAGDNFEDAGDKYYTNYLAAAKQLGITSGVGGNSFAPDREITRQDMITLLYRLLIFKEAVPSTSGENNMEEFADASRIADYAVEAMKKLVAAGIVNGSNEKLNPESSSTRAELTQLLFNLLARK